jgi:hypothetical protein
MIPNRSIRSTPGADAWNKAREQIRSHEPLQSPGVLTGHSIHGVTREVEPSTPPYGSPSPGRLQTYRVKSKIDDVLICRTWDGTTEGTTDVPIAVNRNSRQLTTETINGVTYTYSAYTDLGDAINFSRRSNNGSTNETQIVTPMWYVNCEIDVIGTNYSGVSYDDTINEAYDLKLIEVSARCWAKIA